MFQCQVYKYVQLLHPLDELMHLPLYNDVLCVLLVFGLTSILSHVSLATLLHFGFHLHGIPFPSLHSQSVCVLRSTYIGRMFLSLSGSLALGK